METGASGETEEVRAVVVLQLLLVGLMTITTNSKQTESGEPIPKEILTQLREGGGGRERESSELRTLLHKD